MRAPISVRIHDTHFGIWQDDASDPSFYRDVFGVLVRDMRSRGWAIRYDPQVKRHYRSLNAQYRLAAKGHLRCELQINGRAIQLEFWSVTARQDNRNGRRYDFDKLNRMQHIDQLRVQLEFDRMLSWLKTIANVDVTRSADRRLSPMQHIEKDYAESVHKDKTLGRPAPRCDSNRHSNDGSLLEQGQTVWLADRKGRIIRGRAFYNINNMWWVIAGGELRNESSRSLYVNPPGDIRTKRNERDARKRLERELSIAVERMDYLRAHRLKAIIFGNEPSYMIWARNKQAFYCSQYAGYTSDLIHAGKYTRVEAEAECRRAPDDLEMVDQHGKHIRFKGVDRSAEAA